MRVCCLFIFTNKGHGIDLGMKSCIIKVGVKALCIAKTPTLSLWKRAIYMLSKEKEHENSAYFSIAFGAAHRFLGTHSHSQTTKMTHRRCSISFLKNKARANKDREISLWQTKKYNKFL